MGNMLQTKTAEEILSTVFKPKEFIIDGLLTQGLYVLAGAQKVGKSWLAMDICLSIATGVPVLGRETIQGTALYLLYSACQSTTISDYSADCFK